MPPQRVRGTAPTLIAMARHLRHNLTPAETRLWNALKNHHLNSLKLKRTECLNLSLSPFSGLRSVSPIAEGTGKANFQSRAR